MLENSQKGVVFWKNGAIFSKFSTLRGMMESFLPRSLTLMATRITLKSHDEPIM